MHCEVSCHLLPNRTSVWECLDGSRLHQQTQTIRVRRGKNSLRYRRPLILCSRLYLLGEENRPQNELGRSSFAHAAGRVSYNLGNTTLRIIFLMPYSMVINFLFFFLRHSPSQAGIASFHGRRYGRPMRTHRPKSDSGRSIRY